MNKQEQDAGIITTLEVLGDTIRSLEIRVNAQSAMLQHRADEIARLSRIIEDKNAKIAKGE